MTEEEVQALVESPEVKATNARSEPKSGDFLEKVSNPFTLVLTDSLDVGEMDGILSVWEEDGMILSKLLLSCDGTPPEPFRVTFEIKQIALIVWGVC